MASCKPWLLLVPQYVARKAFYLDWMSNKRASSGACRPVFLGPTERPYVFAAPVVRADVRSMRLPGQEGQAEELGDDQKGISALEPGADVALPAGPQQALEVTPSKAAPLGNRQGGVPPYEGSGGQAVSTPTAVGAAAAAQGGTPFEVAAGSFQCVWFVSLGPTHQQPIVEWWRKSIESSTAAAAAAAVPRPEAGAEGGVGGPLRGIRPAGCMIVASVAELPVLTAAPKLSPAERRWRKKQAMLQVEGGGEAMAEGSSRGGEGAPKPAGRSGRAEVKGAGRPGAATPGGRLATAGSQRNGRLQQGGKDDGIGIMPTSKHRTNGFASKNT